MFFHKTRLAISRGKGIALSVVFFATVLVVSPAASQQESVVLIHAGNASGYGVAYGGPGNIVTALHVVAGRSPITIVWKGKQFPAKIDKILKPADLALLRFTSDPPNIPPLKTYPGTPPMKTSVNFWVAPQGSSMDKKETKLDKTAPLEDLYKRIENNAAAFAKALCSDGQTNYPALTTKVFRFENVNIGKAHSGSPLTYEGYIIGMVDGGPPISGKGSIWAIPAASNFDKLLREGSPVAPGSVCSSDRLYSGIRADNPHLDPKLAGLAREMAASERNPFVVTDDNGDELAFRLDYRATFRDIYDTMLPEDKQFINELLEDEKYYSDGKVTLQDLFKQSIDVFQDDEAGAVIAIPTGSELMVEQESGHTLVGVTTPREGTTMILSVQATASAKGSIQAKNWFEQFILTGGPTWKKEEEDDIENSLDDPDDPYYDALLDRVAYSADGETVVAELFASLTIEDKTFLGVSIIVLERDRLTKNERVYNYLMEACAILADFTYH
jgi:hypothetical protein